MLDDKDRIFRNLYGLQDWGLEAARRRGAWDGTKAIIDKGRDWIINEMKASGLRGRGGAGCSQLPQTARAPEGMQGEAGWTPAFPANGGLFGCPHTVNNVESIAVAADILRRGAAWFAAIGRPNNVGTKLFCISGHVERPCNVEEAMGIPFRELIERHCGGIRGGWDNLKGCVPGGPSVRVVTTPQSIAFPLSFHCL